MKRLFGIVALALACLVGLAGCYKPPKDPATEAMERLADRVNDDKADADTITMAEYNKISVGQELMPITSTIGALFPDDYLSSEYTEGGKKYRVYVWPGVSGGRAELTFVEDGMRYKLTKKTQTGLK